MVTSTEAVAQNDKCTRSKLLYILSTITLLKIIYDDNNNNNSHKFCPKPVSTLSLFRRQCVQTSLGMMDIAFHVLKHRQPDPTDCTLNVSVALDVATNQKIEPYIHHRHHC